MGTDDLNEKVEGASECDCTACREGDAEACLKYSSEDELIMVAEQHPSEDRAEEAMRLLRKKFDPTYGWCEDCDGLVCTERDCCLYRTLPTTL